MFISLTKSYLLTFKIIFENIFIFRYDLIKKNLSSIILKIIVIFIIILIILQ